MKNIQKVLVYDYEKNEYQNISNVIPLIIAPVDLSISKGKRYKKAITAVKIFINRYNKNKFDIEYSLYDINYNKLIVTIPNRENIAIIKCNSEIGGILTIDKGKLKIYLK